MKTINMLIRIVSALAAVAGAIYVVATYGDQIVAWAKKMLDKFPQCTVEVDFEKEGPAEAAAEEAGAEIKEEEVSETAEAPAEEAVPTVEEETVTATAEDVPVADEADFEG